MRHYHQIPTDVVIIPVKRRALGFVLWWSLPSSVAYVACLFHRLRYAIRHNITKRMASETQCGAGQAGHVQQDAVEPLDEQRADCGLEDFLSTSSKIGSIVYRLDRLKNSARSANDRSWALRCPPSPRARRSRRWALARSPPGRGGCGCARRAKQAGASQQAAPTNSTGKTGTERKLIKYYLSYFTRLYR
jgi:hypothetical protein